MTSTARKAGGTGRSSAKQAFPRLVVALLAAAGLGGDGLPAPAEGQSNGDPATYTVTFQGEWTTSSTPGGVVGGAHFTTLIGAVHNREVTLWSPGGTATPGIEGVAELGATGTFRSEINAKGADVASIIQQPVGFGGRGSATFKIEVTTDHPLVTLVSMIGPSPDWFVGVSRLSLHEGGQWRSQRSVNLYPYDAGTEEGEEFSLSNPATSPQGRITSIRGMGKFSNEPMATLSFVRKDDMAGAVHHVPLFLPASDPLGRQSFARIVNHSAEDGAVRIDAFDDKGSAYGPLTLTIEANETVHINSGDLEDGNVDKGLDGATGRGEGRWRLELTSPPDIEVLAYMRTEDGFVTSMHDVAPHTGNGYHVAVFNPGRNASQVSHLRLINRGAETAEVIIEGFDGRGASPGTQVRLSVPARGARELTARELESDEARGEAAQDIDGALGEGAGKWRLVVTSDRPIEVMSLLASPTGHLTNLSTAPGRMEPAPVQ